MLRRDLLDFRADRLTERPDGTVVVDGNIGRVGVFPYLNADGSIRHEFRPPEEVGHPDSLKSFELKPMTFFSHPANMLAVDASPTSDEIKDHISGTTGAPVTFDGEFVNSEIALMAKEAIEGMNAGITQLSPGYTVRVVGVNDALDLPSVAASPGVWKGISYTHVQRDIRGNHITQLKQGRQGSSVSLRLDMAIQRDQTDMSTKTVKLLGQTFENVPEALATAMDSAGLLGTDTPPNKNKEHHKALEILQAKLDAAEEKAKKLEESQATLPDSIRADIAFEVKAATLLDKPTETFSGKPRREIMETVLNERLDGLDLKDRSDEYVEARFDILLEDVPENPSKATSTLREATTPEPKKVQDERNDEILDYWASRSLESGNLSSQKGA